MFFRRKTDTAPVPVTPDVENPAGTEPLDWYDIDTVKSRFGTALSELVSARGIALPDEVFLETMFDALDAAWCQAVISAVETGTTQVVSDDTTDTSPDITSDTALVSPQVETDTAGISSGISDTAPMTPAPGRDTGSVPVSAPTDTSDTALFERGIRIFAASVSAGKPLSDRALAKELGQTGTRLARKVKAHVTEGAERA